MGERGVPLSPDTLVLPASVDAVPRSVVRNFENVSDKTARLLVLITGGSEEDFNDVEYTPAEADRVRLLHLVEEIRSGAHVYRDMEFGLRIRGERWLQVEIQAFRLAETINLPVMVILDAFFLSHTSEPVDVTDQELVDEFLPKREAQYKLDPADPHAFGALVRPDAYMEMRWQQQEAMRDTLTLMPEIDEAWASVPTATPLPWCPAIPC